MKTQLNRLGAGLALAFLATLNSQLSTARAGTTIDAVNHYAYAANLGWVDCRINTKFNATAIGEYVCSGYIYSANVGWINLGSGSPANGIQYQNNSATNFGVNQDGLGNLRGYAWGANVGWIAFEDTGAPKVDPYTGKLSGSVWSANCGWISLSNAVACVQTDVIAPGTDSDHDGLPDAWELQNWGQLRPLPNVDSDGDGMSNLQEYLAGTNPRNAKDFLRITIFQRGQPGDPDCIDLQWTSQPTRFYAIEQCPALGGTNTWADAAILPWMGINNVEFDDTNNVCGFYRVRAFRPLMP